MAEFDRYLITVVASECDPSLGGEKMRMHTCIALLSSTILSRFQH